MYRPHVLRVLSVQPGSRLPKCSAVAGNIFHCLRSPGHLLYKLIAGICGGEHGHQSFPLLGHSPASTFISCVIKLVMFTHSSLTDAAVVTFVVTHEAERHVLCVSHTSPALPLWLQRE